MDEEKAAAITSPEDILFFDNRHGRITSPEDIRRTSLTKKIKKIEQSPLGFNIPPTLFKNNRLLPTPQPPLDRRVKKIMTF